jgi:hypothetical protein
MTKICNLCKKEKSLEEFNRAKSTVDGYTHRCKECNTLYGRFYRQENKRKLQQYQEWEENSRKEAKVQERKEKEKVRRKKYYPVLQERRKTNRYTLCGQGAVSRMRAASSKRGQEFTLTKEELQEWWDRTPDVCEYCGHSVEEYISIKNRIVQYGGNHPLMKSICSRCLLSGGQKNMNHLTIDRKDNSKGYTTSNMC